MYAAASRKLQTSMGVFYILYRVVIHPCPKQCWGAALWCLILFTAGKHLIGIFSGRGKWILSALMEQIHLCAHDYLLSFLITCLACWCYLTLSLSRRKQSVKHHKYSGGGLYIRLVSNNQRFKAELPFVPVCRKHVQRNCTKVKIQMLYWCFFINMAYFTTHKYTSDIKSNIKKTHEQK